MSIEIHVLSDRRLSSLAQWQEAIDAERFGGLNLLRALKLSQEGEFDDINGFLPVNLLGDESGFECYHDDAREFIESCSDVDFGRPWKFVLSFRWSSNVDEALSAWIAATAYARATDGIVYDSESGSIHTPQEAVKIVREIDYELPSRGKRALARLVAKMMRPIRAYYFPQ